MNLQSLNLPWVQRARKWPWTAAWLLAGGVLVAEAARTEERVERSVPVRVDLRVELLSTVFRLAGNPEYNQGRLPFYLGAVTAHFQAFTNHGVVRTARRLRNERGISYDAVMSFAVHITDQLEPIHPFTPLPETLDSRWRPADAEAFLGQLRDFARESDFQGFFDEQRPLYQTAVSRMETLLGTQADLAWFDRFFGARASTRFQIILGMLNGGGSYAARIRAESDTEDLFCILGVWSVDWLGQPRFPPSVLSTVVHEFGHAYVNPLVYAHPDELRSAGLTLYPHVEQAMRRQAYGQWATMMHESLVRASVVRYLAATEGSAAAEREIERQVKDCSFLWTRELAELLADYERRRDAFPTFEAFFPEVIRFFEGYAEGFADRAEAAQRLAPRVVRMVPENRDDDVDPALASVVIVFDRAMQPGYSFVGGGPRYPGTSGRPSWDDTRTRIELPVRLEPDREYEFWLNRGRFNSFRGQDGTPLPSLHVTFRTGAGR